MSALGLPIFDKAVQDANIWVNDVMDMLDWDDKQRAYLLLRQTLHVLRDRLPRNECAHFAAQLPTLIRGIFYEGYQPAKLAKDIKRREQFVHAVEKAFVDNPLGDPDRSVVIVLDVISQHISWGEIEDIMSSMPADIRTLWEPIESL